MASQQQHRRDIDVEKDLVPKLAEHFEELAHSTDADTVVVTAISHTTTPAAPSHFDSLSNQQKGRGQGKNTTPSIEEVSSYRQTAQRNSMDAIQAAKQRYDIAKEGVKQGASTAATKAPEIGSYDREKTRVTVTKVPEMDSQAQEKARAMAAKASALGSQAQEKARQGLAMATKAAELGSQAQENARQGVGTTTQFILEKSVPGASEKAQSRQAKEYTKQTAQQAKEYTGEKAAKAKDTVMGATKNVTGYVGEKAAAAKDVALGTGKTAVQVAKEVKDQAAKAGQGAAHATAEMGVGATKMASEMAGYVGDKALAAKDVALGTGKKTAQYAGMVAEEVKDQTVSTGRGAAHATTEMAVGATKMAGGVAGYVGEKVITAKDLALGTGKTAAQYAGTVVEEVKDEAVEVGSRAAHATAEMAVGATKLAADATTEMAVGTTKMAGGVVGYVGEKAVAAKDMALGTGKTTAQYARRAVEEVKDEAVEVGSRAAHATAEMAVGATKLAADATAEMAVGATKMAGGVAGYVGEKAVAAKDVALGTGKTTTQYARRAVEEVKDEAVEVGSSAAHATAEMAVGTTKLAADTTAEMAVGATKMAGGVAGYVGDKAIAAKDMALGTGKTTIQYAGTVVEEVKDQAAEAGSRAAYATTEMAAGATKIAGGVAGYVGEKAVAAKDVALETGKTTVEYAGKVAEDVKDQAVVAGWGAAHYTTEMAVEGTKMAGAAIGKAKDVAVSAAHKAAELAEKPVVMAKDTIVQTGESLADYTARKKMEAEMYEKDKRSMYYAEEERKPTIGERITMKWQESEETTKGRRMSGEDETETEKTIRDSEGGMLGAIGETIVEIAQHTTQLVAGSPTTKVEVQEKETGK